MINTRTSRRFYAEKPALASPVCPVRRVI
jgi:hypothetical protein